MDGLLRHPANQSNPDFVGEPDGLDSQLDAVPTVEFQSSMDGSSSTFHPVCVGALYPGIERGLSADVLAVRAMGGQALPVCTSLVVAGRGTVTDVLDVPTDTIDAQLSHLFDTRCPTAAKVGILNHPATVESVFRHMNDALSGPFVYDLTLSGPSGEDIISQRALDAVHDHLSIPDLVTLRVHDAELIAGMEIPSLDDAQVAIQRIGQLGAAHVLLRCGRLPTHFFDVDSEPPDYAVDLFYDGDDFALYEAPYVPAEDIHGASSAFLVALLRALSLDVPLTDALQAAKAYVTESLRHGREDASVDAPNYFWNRSQDAVLPNI